MKEETTKTQNSHLDINEESSDKTEAYFTIHPMVLRIDTVQSFNVFKKNSTSDYELFHPASKAYTSTVHGSIFKNSISRLYVKDSYKSDYYRYLENFFIIVMNDPFINSYTKAQISHDLITYIAKLVCKKPEKEIIIRYKTIIKSITDFVIKDKDAINNIISMVNPSCTDYNHLVNVGIYGMGLAKEIFVKEINFDMSEIAAGFFLHDIGKLNIPKHIIHKQGILTDREWKIIKTHPLEGYNILKKLDVLTKESEIIVLQHHERHDGNGYPKGLQGDQIHKFSKICSIADAFDALTSYRPFRKSKSSFEALQVMYSEMKNEFDPTFFSKFVLLFRRTK